MSNKENLVNIFEELHEQIIIAPLHASNVNYGQIHASIAEPFSYDPAWPAHNTRVTENYSFACLHFTVPSD